MSRRREPVERAEIARWAAALESGISVVDFARRFHITTKSAREAAQRAGVQLPRIRGGRRDRDAG